MFTISESRMIEVIKGDTGILDLTLDNYKLKDGDKVYFTLKMPNNSEPLILKEVTKFVDGKAKFIFSTEDTNIDVGIYRYEVKCNLADGRVDTVIKPSKFKVLRGV